jgi:hypothetical protein
MIILVREHSETDNVESVICFSLKKNIKKFSHQTQTDEYVSKKKEIHVQLEKQKYPLIWV